MMSFFRSFVNVFLKNNVNLDEINKKTSDEIVSSKIDCYIASITNEIKNQDVVNILKSSLEKDFILGKQIVDKAKLKEFELLALKKGIDIDAEIEKLICKIKKMPDKIVNELNKKDSQKRI